MRLPAVEDVVVPAKRRLSRLRRENREFDRFVQTLDYVPKPVEEPIGDNDFIICGSPRSGTTLLAAQLFQPTSVVTVVEPWIGLKESPATAFRMVREGLADGELRHGRLDVPALRDGRRVRWSDNETSTIVGPATMQTLVGIKWPAWWQYLGRLPDARFIVCVREPGEVISSYRHTGGSLREGLDYPARLNDEFNRTLRRRTRSLAARRALLFETINNEVLRHAGRNKVLIVRYERWFDDRDALGRDLEAFLGIDLGPWPVDITVPNSSGQHQTVAPMTASLRDVCNRLGYGASC